MKIELEGTFKEALSKGINLFLGAGFSVCAADIKGRKLPLGFELLEELKKHFQITSDFNLSRMAQIIEIKHNEKFKAYLRERFTVVDYDTRYNCLDHFKIDNIFTTNIDDLIPYIYQDSKKSYINDVTQNGLSFREKTAVQYFALHGLITNESRPLIFNSLEIAKAFSNDPKTWYHIAFLLEKQPVLFWGQSINDSDVLQALPAIAQNNFPKWIVVPEQNVADIEYYRALGFYIIESTTEDLLTYLHRESLKTFNAKTVSTIPIDELLKEYSVPKSLKGLPIRSIAEYYYGSAPIWSEIIENRIYKTSWYNKVYNLIVSSKHCIVIGLPATGKTTLMMQLAAGVQYEGIKLVCTSITFEKARMLANALQGIPALVFVDNFSDTVSSFDLLSNISNIKLVGFDRQHNFEIISHLIDRESFDIINITDLNELDVKEIIAKVPQDVKRNYAKYPQKDKLTSIFELVTQYILNTQISTRYVHVIEEINSKSEDLIDSLVMFSYVYSCRTPVSYEMISAFLDVDFTNYEEVYDHVDQLGSFVKDYDENINLKETYSQDYFAARSTIIAETILNNTPPKILSRVLKRFFENVPSYLIAHYDVFKKKAYDAYFVHRAFSVTQEGTDFYDYLADNDPHNPYIFQQKALFLLRRKKYELAFFAIDEAKNISDGRIFSIRNTYAIILFEANYDKIEDRAKIVRRTLEESLDILADCYKNDKRKIFHAKAFADEALKYDKRYRNDPKSLDYLSKAKNWVGDELTKNYWDKSLRALQQDLNNILMTY